MTKALKTRFSIIGFAALIAVIAAIIYFQDASGKDVKLARSLEAHVLPFVVENKISLFLDADWCKALQYNSRSVVEVSNNVGDTPCLTKAEPFSDHDWSIFNELKSRLQAVPRAGFREVSIEHPLGRAEHALLPDKSIGTAFSIDCSFCRTRYVYWPNYPQLPPNIDAEITYTPTDKDWYRIDQDWN